MNAPILGPPPGSSLLQTTRCMADVHRCRSFLWSLQSCAECMSRWHSTTCHPATDSMFFSCTAVNSARGPTRGRLSVLCRHVVLSLFFISISISLSLVLSFSLSLSPSLHVRMCVHERAYANFQQPFSFMNRLVTSPFCSVPPNSQQLQLPQKVRQTQCPKPLTSTSTYFWSPHTPHTNQQPDPFNPTAWN